MDIVSNIKSFKKKINEIKDFHSKKGYYTKVIHYSCSGFKIDNSRITCISIYDMETGVNKSFSLFHYQDPLHPETSLDIIEHRMLVDYNNYIKDNKHYFWVHWNMNNDTYGFGVIEKRLKKLNSMISCYNSEPFIIDDKMKISLTKTLYDIYGDNYIKDGKLYNLFLKNKLHKPNLIDGNNEAKAFEEKNYESISLSNQVKVELIYYVYDLLIKDKLKTDKSIWKIYGVTIQGITDLLKDHWLGSVILFVIIELGSLLLESLSS